MTSAVGSKPSPLAPSDKVSIVAPAGPFDREGFDVGLGVLRSRYQPSFNEDIFSQALYLAGDDQRRLSELVSACADPNTRAVFCARGGYGAMRLLSRLDPSTFPLKPLVGFSDITALHCAWQTLGRVSIHGPVLTQLGRSPPQVVERLWEVLESRSAVSPLTGTETYVPGHVEGRLLGGNLSVFSRLIGTPYLPDLRGAVLLLEDVGERPYRLDRMWTHLKLAGVFKDLAGIVLGEFTGCDEPNGSHTSAQVLVELARAEGLPCAAGFSIGHGTINLAVPLGVQVRLDATARRLEFLESATTGAFLT